ncbi:unnamed protein product, partial [Meganyctiphanes norvegica]
MSRDRKTMKKINSEVKTVGDIRNIVHTNSQWTISFGNIYILVESTKNGISFGGEWGYYLVYIVPFYMLLTRLRWVTVFFSGLCAATEKLSVTVSRSVVLCTLDSQCSQYVGWIHLRRQMIVAVHTRLITRISRYSVTHDSHKTWTLHVNGVTEDDRGYYMCQINTDPALSQVGYMQVVVPPTIVDEESSKSEIQVREKSDVTLKCTAKGFPEPRIRWKREDGEMIVTNTRQPVVVYEGEELHLKSVSRTEMGAYLCIASNGVPPSVSKRITLEVEFPPQIHVPNQLVGVPTGDNVSIECFVEAYPKAISYWIRKDQMILKSEKHHTETYQSLYKIHMTMTVFNFSRSDNTTYKCVAKNSLGETEGDIKLNEIYLPPKAKEIRSGNSEREEVTYSIVSTKQREPLVQHGEINQGRGEMPREERLPPIQQPFDPVNYEPMSGVSQSSSRNQVLYICILVLSNICCTQLLLQMLQPI